MVVATFALDRHIGSEMHGQTRWDRIIFVRVHMTRLSLAELKIPERQDVFGKYIHHIMEHTVLTA